jgi:hypothetical protein
MRSCAINLWISLGFAGADAAAAPERAQNRRVPSPWHRLPGMVEVDAAAQAAAGFQNGDYAARAGLDVEGGAASAEIGCVP